MKTRAPFGAWESPITPDTMAKAGARLGSPRIEADGSFTWSESRPGEGGRVTVLRSRRSSGSAPVEELVPAPFSVRTRVHEYGGRAHAIDGETIFFVSQADQRLHRVEAGRAPEPVTDGAVRIAEPLVDARRGRVVSVTERPRDGAEPEAAIGALDLATGRIEALASGHDFFSSPVLSPQGDRLAYLAWDHPVMPWDGARLYLQPLSREGACEGPPRPIPPERGALGAAIQPAFGADGTLHACVEAGDRFALHRVEEERLVSLGAAPDLELGAAIWSLGTRLFAFADEGSVVGVACGQGRSQLVRVDLATGALARLPTPHAMIGELDCRGRDLLYTVGWAGQGTKLVHLDLETGRFEVVRDALAGAIEPEDTSEPEDVAFPTSDGDTAYGFFYPPRNARFEGPEGEAPPLVVVAHGGPTGCASPTPQLSIQFWTTRGFAVLDVNYRGSTTFGRAYREKLRGRWGVVDVDDCIAGAKHLAAAGRVDPKRAIVRGSSAGGYTVLRVVTKDGFFRAAACLYGPSDPRALAAATHKFESRYDRFLFGEGEAYERALDERCPLRDADRIETPIIFFQGLEDPAVPPDQTRRMFEALVARGVTTELHAYEGEGHGFRKAETIRDVWTRELAFYRRVLALG